MAAGGGSGGGGDGSWPVTAMLKVAPAAGHTGAGIRPLLAVLSLPLMVECSGAGGEAASAAVGGGGRLDFVGEVDRLAAAVHADACREIMVEGHHTTQPQPGGVVGSGFRLVAAESGSHLG